MLGDATVGKGKLEPFTLQPLGSTYVSGTFRSEGAAGDVTQPVKIAGVTKYDMLLASIEVPFVYHPTAEQAMEFIHQG